MADAGRGSHGVDKVKEFLKARNVKDEVIKNFEKEKMDVEAVKFASEKLLTDLGLEAKGDILALQSFANRNEPAGNFEYEERKRKLIDELKKGRQKGKKQKVSETNTEVKIKTRKISLGWMHWNTDNRPHKYASVRNGNGGGSRRIDMPLNSSKTDIIDDAKALFFPDGISPQGSAEDMQFDLANFKGDVISCPMNDGEPFTLQSYIEKHKLTHVRLYLTSKDDSIQSSSDREDEEHEEEDDEESLLKPMIHFKPAKSASNTRDRGKEWRASLLNSHSETRTSSPEILDLDSDDDNDDIHNSSYPSTCTSTSNPLNTQLIGSSVQRAALIKDQDDALQCSLEADRQKEEERRKKEDDASRKVENLERKRKCRLSRVPQEPTSSHDGQNITVAVKHIFKGKVTRTFTDQDNMRDVYNWVGSLSSEPEYFRLCLLPGVAIDPLASLYCVKGTLLYMEATEDDIFDSVSNISKIDVDSDALQQLLDNIPDVLLEDDEEECTSEIEHHASIMNKRQQFLDTLSGADVKVTVTRENIVRDLLDAYKRMGDMTDRPVYVNFVGEAGVGTGVSIEAYTLFWDTLLTQNSQGDSEFTIPIDLSLSEEDYVSMGKIITHQFILFGTFPIRINQASIHHMLFGEADNSCKIDSFLRLFPPKERDCLSRAVSGHMPFPVDEVVEILEDFQGIRQMPSPSNIKEILVQVATNELVAKPYLPLTNIKKGLGVIWKDVSKQEIGSLYALSRPTPERVLESLIFSPSSAKEEQIFRWLKRYIKGSDDRLLSKFLRFCTASDVITEAKISLSIELYPPTMVRPKAQTCFRMLTIPRNYENFTQMKQNLDTYFKDSTIWDLEDL